MHTRIQKRPWRAPLMAAALLAAGGLSACDGGSIEPGRYRGVLKLAGGELPFALELNRNGTTTTGILRSGGEPLQLTMVRTEGARLEIFLRGDDSRILAKRHGTDLDGEWVVRDAARQERRIGFQARRGAGFRFFETASTDNADVSGRWTMLFSAAPGRTQTVAAELKQLHAEVTGTLALPNGEARRVAGEVHNDDLYLSSFDGSQAFLYKATVMKDGSLKGESWSAVGEHIHWTARHEDATGSQAQPTES